MDEDENNNNNLYKIAKKVSHNKAEEDDETYENEVLFYVNRSGFPIDNSTYERMWLHVCKIHPDGDSLEKSIRNQKNLNEVQSCVYIRMRP